MLTESGAIVIVQGEGIAALSARSNSKGKMSCETSSESS
jgi:hypothetical protein